MSTPGPTPGPTPGASVMCTELASTNGGDILGICISGSPIYKPEDACDTLAHGSGDRTTTAVQIKPFSRQSYYCMITAD